MNHTIWLNEPSRLPPPGCRLLIKVGDELLKARRTGWAPTKHSELEYEIERSSERIVGSFAWTLP